MPSNQSRKPAKRTTAKKGKPTPRRTAKKATAPSAVNVPDAVVPSTGDDQYAPTAWGEQPQTFGEDLKVPSGQLCRVRRPGLRGLVAAGVLDNIDSLTAHVDTKHVQRAKKGFTPELDVASMVKDVPTILKTIDITDKVVEFVVLQPKIHPSPRCEREVDGKACDQPVEWHEFAKEADHEPEFKAEPGKVYCYMVDINDKMFILNFAVGGTRDLERFRKQSAELMAGLPSGEDTEGATE